MGKKRKGETKKEQSLRKKNKGGCIKRGGEEKTL